MGNRGVEYFELGEAIFETNCEIFGFGRGGPGALSHMLSRECGCKFEIRVEILWFVEPASTSSQGSGECTVGNIGMKISKTSSH